MQPIIDDLSPTSKKMTIEIPFAGYSGELDKIIAELSSSDNYKGFRPGKAPKSVIFNKHQKLITARLTRSVIVAAVENALKETSLVPVTSPILEPVEVKDGKPIVCSFTFDLIPPVDLPDFSGYEFSKIAPKVTDEAVDEQLRALAESVATITAAPPDHEIRKGDQAQIEFEVFDGDGARLVDLTSQTFDLNGKTLLPALEDALIGLKAGGSVSVIADLPAKLAGEAKKTGRYELKVLNVSKRIIPPIDDEMAKDLNIPEVGSLEDLKKHVADNLLAYQESVISDNLENQVCEKLYHSVSVDLPESLIEVEIDKAITREREAQRAKRNQEHKDSLETWLNNQMLRDAFRDSAIYSLKISAIFSEIASKNELAVTDDEIDAAMKNDFADFNQDVSALKGQSKAPPYVDLYRNRLLSKKICEFVLSKGQVTEVEQLGGPWPGMADSDDPRTAGPGEPPADTPSASAPDPLSAAAPDSGRPE